MISNLSLSGLHIEKKLPLPVGSMINLEVALLDPNEVIPFKGIIMNTYKDSDSNITGTGVKFVEMSENVRKKLETYIGKTIK
jgi:Tfp pilus assembly protein PilZ